MDDSQPLQYASPLPQRPGGFDVTTPDSTKEGEDGGDGLQLAPSGEDGPHGRESNPRQRKAPPPRVAGDAPGESALREQRKRREDRFRERAIDTALEKVRGWLA